MYYVEKDGKGYLHLHDTGNVRDEAIKFLADNGASADIVAYDCTFGESAGNLTARHMGLPDVLIIREKLAEACITAKDTKHIITHFSHNCNPSRSHMQEMASPHNLIAAYDGFSVSV